MIGLNAIYNNDVIQVFDRSSLTETFTKAIIDLPILGLRKELDSGSNPTIGTFLSPNSIIGVEFPTEIDAVVTIKYTLLSPVNASGLSYNVNDNLVYKTGIFNLFSGTDRIFIDKLYYIDKVRSTADVLFLTEPIEGTGTVYLAYYLEKCIAVFNQIPCKIKSITFSMFEQCCNDKSKDTLDWAYRYMQAIKVQQDCNDCGKMKDLLHKLKNLLDVC